MKILVIGGFFFGSLTESYARAFEKLDHEVFRFDSERAYCEAAWWAGKHWARRLSRRLLWNRMNLSTIEVVRCVQPDFVFVVKGTYMDPETIRQIRAKEGIPIVNYYPDNPYCGVPLNPRKPSNQRRDLINVLGNYSRVFIWQKQLAKLLDADGVASSYLPFGVDSDQFQPCVRHPCKECGKQHAAVFVGSYRTKREVHLRAIRRHQVGLWGGHWQERKCLHGQHLVHTNQAYGNACAAIYAGATVSLNILEDLNMPGHNMRTFEIPASGGLMLSTYTAEQAEFFPEGEAAWYYRSPGEIDAIINRALSDQEALKKMRSTALQLAQDHTYPQRAMALLKEISK